MLYEGESLTPDLKVLLIDDLKTANVIGHYLRHEHVIVSNAPDPYFTLAARDWPAANHALRYPPPTKWDVLFLDNHLDVDRHDDHLGIQLCQWLVSNPYFLPREIYLVSFDGRSDKAMYEILSKVYMASMKPNFHVFKPITGV